MINHFHFQVVINGLKEQPLTTAGPTMQWFCKTDSTKKTTISIGVLKRTHWYNSTKKENKISNREWNWDWDLFGGQKIKN